MLPANFATSIAIVESGNISNPPLGDGGRAIGRYQQHPDFFWLWAVNLKITPALGETWDSLFMRVVQGYFSYHTGQGLTAVQCAVSYHVGHVVREGDSTWDADYAARFADAARSIGGDLTVVQAG